MHAQCDGLDELGLAVAAAAATRRYVAPRHRAPGDAPVCVGELERARVANSAWPVRAMKRVRECERERERKTYQDTETDRNRQTRPAGRTDGRTEIRQCARARAPRRLTVSLSHCKIGAVSL